MKLTAARVRAAKPDQGELLNDGNGLYLRVRPNSTTWIVRCKRFGRMTVSKLGKYPALSLAEARLMAVADKLNNGGSNATVSEVVTKYAKEVISHHKRPQMARGYMDRAVLPAIGHRKVRDLPVPIWSHWYRITPATVGGQRMWPCWPWIIGAGAITQEHDEFGHPFGRPTGPLGRRPGK